jgi:hypothetical protein
MANKYKAKKTVIDGHEFPSRREAEYYLLYKSMLQRGEIKNLQLQPRFELIPAYVNWEGKKRRPMNYTADFLLTYPDGRLVVVEVKGYKTRDYQLRRKLFEYEYKEYEFQEVR